MLHSILPVSHDVINLQEPSCSPGWAALIVSWKNTKRTKKINLIEIELMDTLQYEEGNVLESKVIVL